MLVFASEKIPIWRRVQRTNFYSWKRLADFLEFDHKQCSSMIKRANFPLNLPFRLAEKIEKKNLEDPILRQFLPTLEETVLREGFVSDPVKDRFFRRENKLLHKYHGRVLLVCTSACAMHCRYCFRKEFSYERSEKKKFHKELELIAKEPSISEVILSGGDPLSLGNTSLSELISHLSSISHVKRLRFHSRYPIGIPERIDDGFLEILSNNCTQTYFVIHCNHPRELDGDVLQVLKKIQQTGTPVLNQAVLLRGVNDRVDVLVSLFERLINHGILPYYLHQLDRVEGAAHFEVPEEEGIKLLKEVMKKLPGYAIPKYAKEIPERLSKTFLF